GTVGFTPRVLLTHFVDGLAAVLIGRVGHWRQIRQASGVVPVKGIVLHPPRGRASAARLIRSRSFSRCSALPVLSASRLDRLPDAHNCHATDSAAPTASR